MHGHPARDSLARCTVGFVGGNAVVAGASYWLGTAVRVLRPAFCGDCQRLLSRDQESRLKITGIAVPSDAPGTQPC